MILKPEVKLQGVMGTSSLPMNPHILNVLLIWFLRFGHWPNFPLCFHTQCILEWCCDPCLPPLETCQILGFGECNGVSTEIPLKSCSFPTQGNPSCRVVGFFPHFFFFFFPLFLKPSYGALQWGFNRILYWEWFSAEFLSSFSEGIRDTKLNWGSSETVQTGLYTWKVL